MTSQPAFWDGSDKAAAGGKVNMFRSGMLLPDSQRYHM